MESASTKRIADDLRIGIERCDVHLITSCFTEDAELQIVDHSHPPSTPLKLRGKDAIHSYYQDICSRGMKHHIDRQILADSEVVLTEACTYPDGHRVLAAEMFELSDGKIFRGTTVQAWDE